jgi:hypothetical protein
MAFIFNKSKELIDEIADEHDILLQLNIFYEN